MTDLDIPLLTYDEESYFWERLLVSQFIVLSSRSEMISAFSVSAFSVHS